MLSKSNLFNKREDTPPNRDSRLGGTPPGGNGSTTSAEAGSTATPSSTASPTGPSTGTATATGAGSTYTSGASTTANPSAPTTSPATTTVSEAKAAAGGDVKPAEGNSENRLIVGPDVKLKGAEILDCDTLIVEGRVEATMDSRVINIAQNGSFSGKVSIDVAEIHGRFEGELIARSRLVIHATGRVSGTIRYGKILIEEGGEVSGDVRSLSADESAQFLTNRAGAMDFSARNRPTPPATH